PVAVLASSDPPAEGWTLASDRPPRWWSGPREPAAPPTVPAAEAAPPARPRPPRPPATLFDQDAAPPAAAATPADWIASLLGSGAYASQRAMAGRMAPRDEDVSAFLDLMERGHGRVSRPALSRALGVPEVRVRGLLAGLQRVLNVGGYPVVAFDEATDTVELDVDLLRMQFELEPKRP